MTEWRPIEYQERTSVSEQSGADRPVLAQEMLKTPVPPPPPSADSAEPSLAAVVFQRVGAMVLSLAIAAVIAGGLAWPIGLRVLPIKVDLSQATALGVLFAGVQGNPATVVSTMVGALLISVAGAAVLAWIVAAVASLTANSARGIAAFATGLTVIHYLLWFAFASSWQLFAPWLVDGYRPIAADGTAQAITAVEFGSTTWWALGFAVAWLLLAMVRNTASGGRAGAAKSALVLMVVLTTLGAVAAMPVKEVGVGAKASSAAALVLAALPNAEGATQILAWTAVGSLGLFLLLAGLTAIRATRRGAAPMLGVLVTIAAALVLLSVGAFVLLINQGLVTDSPFGWVLGPYRPFNQVTVFAVLALTALFAVSTSQLKRDPKPVVRHVAEERVLLGEVVGERA